MDIIKLRVTTNMVPRLWSYLINGHWTLKISPAVPGLRVNIKNGPFALFLRRKCPFEAF